MKKTQIILVVAIAAILGLMIVSLWDNSRSYATFEVAAKHPNKSFDIVGVLDMNQPIYYDAKVNSDAFSFYMYDQDSVNRKVVVNKPKPQDFEKSTQVVVTGSMKGGEFKGTSILLKCPSKYEGGSPAIEIEEVKL
ncbi:MAG: cytochrome c maturation protein CcmE [Bacteroidales bacterium]|nr:cytochrome c maturation protein CcmE [Bacteroidales bacterium]